MLREATVGALVLQREKRSPDATAAVAGTFSFAASTAALATPRDSEERYSVLRQRTTSFTDNARRTYSTILPLLPENEPAGERCKSVPLAGSAMNSRASQPQVLAAELVRSDLSIQGPLSRLQPLSSEQQQQVPGPAKRVARRTARASASPSGNAGPYMQAACLVGSSCDVILVSFESLSHLLFSSALSEQAQNLLLLDQVVYSTSLLSTFLFAMLLTNFLDPVDPTASVYCIWFSLVAVTAACIIGRPMARALDDEVQIGETSPILPVLGLPKAFLVRVSELRAETIQFSL